MKIKDANLPGIPGLLILNAINKLGVQSTGLALIAYTDMQEGGVYNLLSRLRKHGFITATRGANTLYELTPLGRKVLNYVSAELS